MIEDALEHLVKGIVDHPDDVSVSNKTTKRGRTLDRKSTRLNSSHT